MNVWNKRTPATHHLLICNYLSSFNLPDLTLLLVHPANIEWMYRSCSDHGVVSQLASSIAIIVSCILGANPRQLASWCDEMKWDEMLSRRSRSPDALLLIAMLNIIHHSVALRWLHAIEIIQIDDTVPFFLWVTVIWHDECDKSVCSGNKLNAIT